MLKKSAKKKSSRKPIQAYAFIDTNIFLDFYRSSNEANLSLLEKLKTKKDRVISTYQVEMEFLKNRQVTLLTAVQAFSSQVTTSVPAVVSDSKIQAALSNLKKDAAKKRTQLEKRVNAILTNPKSNDRVYAVLAEIFTSTAGHVLTRDMKERHQIKRLAWKRFMLGYPPRKDRDTSVGDALNWEWIVHCAKNMRGRFYIVTRDGDYGCEFNGEYFLNDQLKAEFRERVGNKSIIFTKKLSDALKALEVHVSKEEVEAEDSSLVAQAVTPGLSSEIAAMETLQMPVYNMQLREALKGMQIPDVSAQMREALKGMQIPDVSAQLRDALKGMQIPDVSAQLREAIRAVQSPRPENGEDYHGGAD